MPLAFTGIFQNNLAYSSIKKYILTGINLEELSRIYRIKQLKHYFNHVLFTFNMFNQELSQLLKLSSDLVSHQKSNYSYNRAYIRKACLIAKV